MRTGFNVLHINTFDIGGAANSCIRLHKGLMNEGVSSALLLKQRVRREPNTFQFSAPVSNTQKLQAKFRRILYEFKLLNDSRTREERRRRDFLFQLPQGSEYFSYPSTGIDVTQSPLFRQADIIHLHWVADFLDYASFFKRTAKPIVWTLHDMGPFSGGHHYEGKFTGMDQKGRSCFREFSAWELKVIDDNLRIKKKALAGAQNIDIVAPSSWLATESQASDLFSRFQHHTIPYGIDHSIFKLRNKRFAREVLNLSLEKKVILFVSDNLANRRKGFDFLLSAFKKFSNDDILLCAVGSGEIDSQCGIIELGRISDERLMSLAYTAADVFVIPSIEDNLPNTMLESLSCGTPVVGFPVGGIAETIRNGFNGYLSSDLSVAGLKTALETFLLNSSSFNNIEISMDANKRFNLEKQARSYVELYLSLLNKRA